jgi:hypothetical protein
VRGAAEQRAEEQESGRREARHGLGSVCGACGACRGAGVGVSVGCGEDDVPLGRVEPLWAVRAPPTPNATWGKGTWDGLSGTTPCTKRCTYSCVILSHKRRPLGGPREGGRARHRRWRRGTTVVVTRPPFGGFSERDARGVYGISSIFGRWRCSRRGGLRACPTPCHCSGAPESPVARWPLCIFTSWMIRRPLLLPPLDPPVFMTGAPYNMRTLHERREGTRVPTAASRPHAFSP